MQHAPPVSYPVRRSRAVGWTTLLVGSAGLLLVGWWTVHAGPSVPRSLVTLAAVVLLAAALREWVRTKEGLLSWDGLCWRWSAAGETAGRLVACLDFQRLVLLRWQPEAGPTQWLWLERRTAPGAWPDLRRAVYSRANPDALPEADSPAANP